MPVLTPKYNLTCEDVARMWGYHVQYVRFLASKGKIPGIKRVSKWLFNGPELEQFFKNHTKGIIPRNANSRQNDKN